MNAAPLLPQWQCHKQVRAARIVDIFPFADDFVGEAGAVLRLAGGASVQVDARWQARHNAHAGGYYVVYEDGYASFSPPAAFEAGYAPLDASAAASPGVAAAPVFPQALALDELELALEEADAQLLEPREQFDPALLGFLESPNVAVYAAPKVIEILMRAQGMSHEDAREWFDFNIAGSRGEGYPVYLWPAEQAHAALTPAPD